MENLILSSYTLQQLQQVVRDCIKQELNVSNPTLAQVEDKLLNSKEAARFLKVSLVTLHKWKVSGQVKFHRIGSRIRYKKSDLDAALLSVSNKPKSKRQ